MSRSAKNKYVSNKVRVLKKEGRSLKEAVAIALSMWEKSKGKNYAEGGAVEGFGIQTTFSQDPSSLQPTDIEEIDKPEMEVEDLLPEPPPTYEEETFGADEFNVNTNR